MNLKIFMMSVSEINRSLRQIYMILDTFLLREHPESLEHHCLGRV